MDAKQIYKEIEKVKKHISNLKYAKQICIDALEAIKQDDARFFRMTNPKDMDFAFYAEASSDKKRISSKIISIDSLLSIYNQRLIALEDELSQFQPQ